jgi:hypothetical protein
VPARGAEREDDRGRGDEARRGRERGGEAPGAARTPLRERRGVELRCQPRVETRRHGSRQRLLAELGECALHCRQLVVRHVAWEAHVVHGR